MKITANKHQVHNLIILDESGSMQSIKTLIIQGFNELVQTIRGIEKQHPDQDHYITFVTFNGLGQKTHLYCQPVKELALLDGNRYNPDASTPLLDAMGSSFHRLRTDLEEISDAHVLVTILTDGEENASKEYSGLAIKKMIRELSLQQWTFTYIGTDHDVEEFAISLSITNTLRFEKNEAGIKSMFLKEQKAREMYSDRIMNKENTLDDFYKDENDESSVKG